MIKSANLAKVKNHLSKFLAEVEQGHEVVICKRNIPVARITRMDRPRKNTSKPGWAGRSVRVHGDLTGPCIPLEDWEMIREDSKSR